MSDLFPALVTVYSADFVLSKKSPFDTVGLSDFSGKKFTECRVIVQKNRLIVGAHTARGVEAVFQGEVSEIFKDSTYTRVLTTENFLVVFAKSKGCGCGSRLKSWNPYGSIARSSKND